MFKFVKTVKSQYKAIFVSEDKETTFVNVRDMDNNLILNKVVFYPAPIMFNNMDLKKGDEVSFFAKSENPNIYGLKHPQGAELLNRWDKDNDSINGYIEKFL